MMKRILILATVALLVPLADPAAAQTHGSELPPLTPDATFPRTTGRQLEVAGYPDHLHAHTWPDWEVLTDADGNTYGPFAHCKHKQVIKEEGLQIHPDQKRIGPWIIRHHPDYSPCDMIQFVELMDWAGHVVPGLLGLEIEGELEILNPDNVKHYQDLTGFGTWRFYDLAGDRCTMQPWPVLQKRTLEAHAAFMLATDWILSRNLGDALPPWLHQGIVEYVGDDGAHLLNYMAEFRADGDILMSAPLVDALLSAGLNPDPSADRENYRRACYSAFLLVWNLVENEGGLTALQDFLGSVRDGADVDETARRVYGMDLTDLAAYLDPTVTGEPVGAGTSRRVPHKQP